MGQARIQQLRDTALKAYQQALQTDPKYLPAYRSLARLYWDLNDPAHAVQQYQKALQLYPKDASLWYELGMGQFRVKDYANGLAALDKAQALEPENREYSNAFGYALARAGRYDQALTVFTRHNDPAKAHYNLARMLAHMGQGDQGLQQVKLALGAEPQPGRGPPALEAEPRGRVPPGGEGVRAAMAQQAAPAGQPVLPVVFTDPSGQVPAGNAGQH